MHKIKVLNGVAYKQLGPVQCLYNRPRKGKKSGTSRWFQNYKSIYARERIYTYTSKPRYESKSYQLNVYPRNCNYCHKYSIYWQCPNKDEIMVI